MQTPTKARAIRVKVKVLACSRCHTVIPLAFQRDEVQLYVSPLGYYRWKHRGMKLKSISLHAATPPRVRKA
jgi:hypothetical protein